MTVETQRCDQLSTGSSYLVVEMSRVAVFGLGSVWS